MTLEIITMSARMKIKIAKMLEHINYLEMHVAARRGKDAEEVMLRVESLRDSISDLVDLSNQPTI